MDVCYQINNLVRQIESIQNSITIINNYITNGASGLPLLIQEDIPVLCNSFGKYVAGDVIPAQGMTIEELFNDIVTVTVHPTYVAPIATLTSNRSNIDIEVGTFIDPVFTGTFTQNDAGAVTGLQIRKDGASRSTTSPAAASPGLVTETPAVYTVTYNYAQGPIKDNNQGVPDSVGRIASGTVTSAPLIYRGYYKIFYDSVDTAPTESSEIRGLTSRFENAGNTFILNTGTTNTKFFIWIPNGKTLVSVIDLDALNLNITNEYIGSSISVNDAGNTPKAGTAYLKTQSIPYSTNHRHQITIS